jgi:hypothetical protein
VHAICHEHNGRPGCGHALDEHGPSLKCRVCKRECGIYCTAAPSPGGPSNG